MPHRIIRSDVPIGPHHVADLGSGRPFSCWRGGNRSPGALVGGRYRREYLIGSGGMGEVWSAHDVRTGSRVALKILPKDLLARRPEARQRFASEAWVLARINSPFVVALHENGTAAEEPYIALELILGEDLYNVIERDGAMDPLRAVTLVRDVAEGLSCAHAVGVVHRDLKPENVMVVETEDGLVAKLIDFGIAQQRSRGPYITDKPVGTLHFMAPEQMCSAQVDARADQWALGVVAYYLLTRELPFDGPTVRDVVRAVVRRPPVPVREHVAGLPGTLDTFFERALAKHPDDRFRDVLELADCLSDALAPLRSGQHARVDLQRAMDAERAHGS